MKLENNNIILRALIESDFDKYFKWHSDPEIRFQTAMHPHLATEEIEKDWFNNAIKDMRNERSIFSIVHKQSNTLIGYFQLTKINMINRNAFAGIVIGEQQYLGQGLGKEVMGLGMNYGFNSLGLNKISLEVVAGNEKAIKLYKMMGFMQEGKFIQDYYNQGRYHDIIRLAIIKEKI
jgi:diamine N-acetyltransferase